MFNNRANARSQRDLLHRQPAQYLNCPLEEDLLQHHLQLAGQLEVDRPLHQLTLHRLLSLHPNLDSELLHRLLTQVNTRDRVDLRCLPEQERLRDLRRLHLHALQKMPSKMLQCSAYRLHSVGRESHQHLFYQAEDRFHLRHHQETSHLRFHPKLHSTMQLHQRQFHLHHLAEIKLRHL